MSRPPEDPEPPRLQDTTERSALPLPLPGQEEPQADPAPPEAVAAEAGPEEAGAADKSPAVDEPAPAEPASAGFAPPEPAPPEPEPADKSPAVEAPGASDNGSPSFQESPFSPPFVDAPSEGPRPEVLIGAAFAGGLLLALIFRRLGR
ncbi:MAG TPA: hypothetical protein VNB64_04360 [Solirubrobacteraceae bacterium]|nr:hypothetical protein [Solirubrobacteraceae bacterium]